MLYVWSSVLNWTHVLDNVVYFNTLCTFVLGVNISLMYFYLLHLASAYICSLKIPEDLDGHSA